MRQHEPNCQLTLFFVDVVGSAQIYDRLGDTEASALIHDIVRLVTDTIEQYNGHVVKTMGDGLMGTFKTAEAAIAAAVFLNRLFLDTAPQKDLPKKAVKIKIGLHHGPVVLTDSDVFGQAVNLAARLVALAKSFQVLTSEETLVDIALNDLAVKTRFIKTLTLKGISEPIRVFEIFSDEVEDVLITQPVETHLGNEDLAARILQVRSGPSLYTIDRAARPNLTIGREMGNDVMVIGDKVSRLHASLEFRGTNFVLTDKSTNGTYVSFTDGTTHFVHIGDFPLWGKGWIGLGREPTPGTTDTVTFEIIQDKLAMEALG
jgi:class 3 adenylate cyclase